ncbi:L,D-transpeptidase family protein [Aquicoccus sp. SCR17]|nr:L,D-transpeptidase family protein [Carideicomes alvinocaridis]
MVLTPTQLLFRGRRFPRALGKGGLTADKREGDGATPRGVLRLTGCLYRPDRIARPNLWARPIGPGDLWSDDPDRPDYNHHVHAPYSGSHERLRRADPLYDLVFLTDWNWPDSVPGRGSAIFLHQWRRPRFPTEGCIAFRREHLQWITARAVPGGRIFIP